MRKSIMSKACGAKLAKWSGMQLKEFTTWVLNDQSNHLLVWNVHRRSLDSVDWVMFLGWPSKAHNWQCIKRAARNWLDGDGNSWGIHDLGAEWPIESLVPVWNDHRPDCTADSGNYVLGVAIWNTNRQCVKLAARNWLNGVGCNLKEFTTWGLNDQSNHLFCLKWPP